MKHKRSISAREAWLLAMMPAALAVIVSFALPKHADQVKALERRLDRASGADGDELLAESKQARDQIGEATRAQQAIEARREAVLAQLEGLQRAPKYAMATSPADQMHRLSEAMAGHGVRVVATAPAKPGEVQPGEAEGWRVTLVGSWPAMHKALADAEAIPSGLRLQTLKMEPPPERAIKLRRWIMEVAVAPADVGDER